ncbi:MAG: hypothetical protein V3V30_00815, partial [Parvularculaceae bacterium]
TIPEKVQALARAADDQEIMALKIRDLPIYGVQFHPESIASDFGEVILKNFLRMTIPLGQAA